MLIKFIKKNYPDVQFGRVEKNIYDMAVEKTILPTQRVRWCCAEYKEMAGAGKVTLIGIRHAESARRAKRKEMEVSNRKFSGDFEAFTAWQEETIKKKYKNLNQDQFSYDKTQEIRCIGGKDSILVSPIIEWTEKDVWEFLNKVCEVPHCELYDKGYHRIGCILCPMSSYKQKLREIEDFPHVKRKWLEAIKKIRMGGGYHKTNLRSTEHTSEGQIRHGFLPQGGGIGRKREQWPLLYNKQERWGLSLTPMAIPNEEDIIAENIFDWWISGKSYEEWYAEKFLQQKIDFDNNEE